MIFTQIFFSSSLKRLPVFFPRYWSSRSSRCFRSNWRFRKIRLYRIRHGRGRNNAGNNGKPWFSKFNSSNSTSRKLQHRQKHQSSKWFTFPRRHAGRSWDSGRDRFNSTQSRYFSIQEQKWWDCDDGKVWLIKQPTFTNCMPYKRFLCHWFFSGLWSKSDTFYLERGQFSFKLKQVDV